MKYKIKREVVAIIIVFIIVGIVSFYGGQDPYFSEVDSSHCDFLGKESAILACYENLSYYENDFNICERLKNVGYGFKEHCYIEFAWKTRNSDICKLSSIQDYKSEQEYSGPDICYYKIVVENSNFFSRRLYEEEIGEMCRKIENSDLRLQCFGAQKFAINESVVEE